MEVLSVWCVESVIKSKMLKAQIYFIVGWEVSKVTPAPRWLEGEGLKIIEISGAAHSTAGTTHSHSHLRLHHSTIVSLYLTFTITLRINSSMSDYTLSFFSPLVFTSYLRLIFTNGVYTCENLRIRFHITDKLQHYCLLSERGREVCWGWVRKGRTVICLGCSCLCILFTFPL